MSLALRPLFFSQKRDFLTDGARGFLPPSLPVKRPIYNYNIFSSKVVKKSLFLSAAGRASFVPSLFLFILTLFMRIRGPKEQKVRAGRGPGPVPCSKNQGLFFVLCLFLRPALRRLGFRFCRLGFNLRCLRLALCRCGRNLRRPAAQFPPAATGSLQFSLRVGLRWPPDRPCPPWAALRPPSGCGTHRRTNVSRSSSALATLCSWSMCCLRISAALVVGVVDQLAHLGVDLRRDRLGIAASCEEVTAEEGLARITPVDHRSQTVRRILTG